MLTIRGEIGSSEASLVDPLGGSINSLSHVGKVSSSRGVVSIDGAVYGRLNGISNIPGSSKGISMRGGKSALSGI